MFQHIATYLTMDTALELLELLFWPSFWLLTYVCLLALVWTAMEQLHARLTLGQTGFAPVSGRRKLGAVLILAGALGLGLDTALWASAVGDLGRAVELLKAHIHGAHDVREQALLVLSTLSILVADLGSLLFLGASPLDQPPQ
ncbi:MAG TPA: hypothetical protein VNK52_10860 [Hyphomicrobiaceae bacterium]|nr:hypothetical protein [Hyphomicrobiaceae bacterium]